MPEMVALFNGFGGIASALVATSVYWKLVVQQGAAGTVADVVGTDEAITVMLSILIGGITFTGSIIALMKLQGNLKKGQPILLPARHFITFGLLFASIAFGAMAVMAAGTDSILWVLLLAGGCTDPRHPAHDPDRRRGHAGRGLAAQLVFGRRSRDGGLRHR